MERRRKFLKQSCVAAAGAIAMLTISPAYAQPALPVDRTLESGQPGRIDLLRYEPAAERLVLVQGNTVTVLAAADGSLQESISFRSKPTALALGHESGKALFALGQQNLLWVVDINGFQVETTLASPIDFASLAAFDRASGSFLVASRRSPGIGAVKPGEGMIKMVGASGPLAALAATGRGWVFGAAVDRPVIYVFDSLSLTGMGTFSAQGCENPSDMALDDLERRLYLTCTNGQLLVFDSDTGVVLARHELPAGASRLIVRTLEGRTIQAIVLAEDASLTVFEGRIMVSGVRNVYRGLDETGKLQMEKGMGRIFLASGSPVSPLAVQRPGTLHAPLGES
ncbi:MAG: hypothetical protein OXF94_02775 [Gammaproteobacteria bacterium]|nr:hypothetical protein [Gammaproteobacteria bacterium]